MNLNAEQKDELFQLRLTSKLDSRTTACRVRVDHSTPSNPVVLGFTQYRQTDAFVKATAQEVYGPDPVEVQLDILEEQSPAFAAVHESFAPVWRNPDSSDPEKLDTQALYGAVVRTYHEDSSYTFVQHSDGYVGYMPTSSLTPVSAENYLAWKNGPHAVTLKPLNAGGAVIPPGARLSHKKDSVVLPCGSELPVSPDQAAFFDPSRSSFVEALEKRAAEFMNSPYLWGGKSADGIDCSGLVQTLALQEGIFLPRDASMQCHVGEIVGYLPDYADLLPGDIMFFMNDKAYVFHVGIYLGNHTYLHSAGSTGPTKSSVYPEGTNYMSRYGSSFVYARRIHR